MLTTLLGAAFGNSVPAVTELNFVFGHKTIPKSLCSVSVAGQIRQNNGAHLSALLGKLLLLQVESERTPKKTPQLPGQLRWRILTEWLCSGSALMMWDRQGGNYHSGKIIRMFLCTECDSRHL